MTSLRARFSLLAVLTTGLLAALLGTAFVLVLQSRLDSASHEELRDRLAATADLVTVDPSGRLSAPAELDEDAWVFDGTALLARAPGSPALQRAVAERAGSTGFTSGPEETLLLAVALPESGPRTGTLVGSLSLKANSHAVDVVQLLVVGIALAGMVGAWGATYLLVGRALRPVVAMTRQAADWSASDVGRRFGDAARPTELSELAATLDGVLDRLSAVLRHEQRLTAELSHELRTPLARVAAEVELLQDRSRDEQELAAGHAAIARGAASMAAILETLLTTGRGGADVPPGRSAARSVLVAAYDGTPVRVEGPDLVVGVDAEVLERIVGPLVDNALRYARERVVVRVVPGPAVEVEDDGPGLPEDLREDVFDPGRRAAPDDGHPGAGLGLALARRLARAAGGDVVLTDPVGGRGLVAKVLLPGG